MTGIAERLRDAAYVEKNALLCATVAANEIERLHRDIMNLEGYLATQRDEIERLQTLVQRYAGETVQAADEIERLTNTSKNCPPVSESEYVRRLEDEIKRLRALIASTRLPQCGCGRDPKTMSLLDGLKP